MVLQLQDTVESEFVQVTIVVPWRYAVKIAGLFIILVFAILIAGATINSFIRDFADMYSCFCYCHYPKFLWEWSY